MGNQAAVIPEKDLFYYDNKWFLLIFAPIDACNKGVKHEIIRNRQFIMENRLYGNLALFAQCATARKTSIFGGFYGYFSLLRHKKLISSLSTHLAEIYPPNTRYIYDNMHLWFNKASKTNEMIVFAMEAPDQWLFFMESFRYCRQKVSKLMRID